MTAASQWQKHPLGNFFAMPAGIHILDSVLLFLPIAALQTLHTRQTL